MRPMSAVGVAHIVVWVAELYAALGAAVALGFVAAGISRTSPRPGRVTIGARALFFPAALALWPLILRRWIVGAWRP